MSPQWSNLIRFVSGGRDYYGDAILSSDKTADDVVDLAKSSKLRARVVEDDPLTVGKVSQKELLVETLLAPLTKAQVPVIRCIGLNYVKHIEEVGRNPPTYPPLFIKPSTSLAGYKQDVRVPKLAQKTTDYEGELTIVIGKSARDIPESEALDHVAGYVVSNDVSCREWQKDRAFGPAGGQWCFSKGFDDWAPIGPVVVSPKVLRDASSLNLTTMVNGEMKQHSNTSDLLFGVKKLVAFCSQGTTLETGSLIMTGTPSGVVSGMENQVFLKDGDVVHVKIDGLGSISNVMKFV
ncbi:hypothetical protein LTR99_011155 [Exophiala xenobiotica]|uniref:Fumarylacetoacetase-like C-terminal domain-containing protein n=1 Tax=Vermiconidia calcicola TaxID=1690605 RepID=A0AAV9PSF2_9PEZI|nr:hypothetical protein LTR92_010978 [Exophiala xenobiotica]KAK5527678.1 hypothetical protein LTR25_011001 [Vermiconidia calcicola]KAK5531556.1 hypothetical protein LTR23_009972 [Chaetothyriales sp. CCFEE 6169]KAK5203102.1 hypothetical protein LTR41_011176 [Exophiala xenobiotica]KAK5263530.1 hypothetical protein LTR96_011062 [Exophiala xenobiotica]